MARAELFSAASQCYLSAGPAESTIAPCSQSDIFPFCSQCLWKSKKGISNSKTYPYIPSMHSLQLSQYFDSRKGKSLTQPAVMVLLGVQFQFTNYKQVQRCAVVFPHLIKMLLCDYEPVLLSLFVSNGDRLNSREGPSLPLSCPNQNTPMEVL